MLQRVALVFGCAVLVLTALVACSQAQETKGVKIGDPAPDWKDIIGVDGKKHSLSDYKDAKIIVMVCTCNHCPVAVAYEDRIIQFQKDYQDKGVQVIAFNVNNIPEDRLDKMIERAKQKGFNFPYIYDPTQKMGHDYGARVTPHFFVLDQERKVRYIGAMDDNNNPARVKRNYLREAVDALLANQPVPVAETQARGCTVKYE
jgi:glutathione peroxidase-family protein